MAAESFSYADQSSGSITFGGGGGGISSPYKLVSLTWRLVDGCADAATDDFRGGRVTEADDVLGGGMSSLCAAFSCGG